MTDLVAGGRQVPGMDAASTNVGGVMPGNCAVAVAPELADVVARATNSTTPGSAVRFRLAHGGAVGEAVSRPREARAAPNPDSSPRGGGRCRGQPRPEAAPSEASEASGMNRNSGGGTPFDYAAKLRTCFLRTHVSKRRHGQLPSTGVVAPVGHGAEGDEAEDRKAQHRARTANEGSTGSSSHTRGGAPRRARIRPRRGPHGPPRPRP